MNSLTRFAFIPILTLSSCDSIRGLAKSSGSGTAPVASSYNGPLVSEIPDGAHATFPLQSGRVVIVDYYADWCGPCRQLAPILARIAEEQKGRVIVGKVDVDRYKELATKEGVGGIPDVRIFRDGKQVDQFVGLPDPAEVRRRIEAQVKGLPEHAAGEITPPAEPSTRPMDKEWLPPGMQRR